MKKFKNQKGITLVALIITIIILLILAVVALREITGDGIIAKAKEARSTFETEQGIENGILADYEDELESALSDGGSTGENQILTELNNFYKGKRISEIFNGEGAFVVGDVELICVDDEAIKIKDNLTESDFVANTEVVLGGVLVTYNNESYTIVYGANKEYDYTNFIFNSSYSSFYGINPVILRIENGHNIIGDEVVR